MKNSSDTTIKKRRIRLTITTTRKFSENVADTPSAAAVGEADNLSAAAIRKLLETASDEIDLLALPVDQTGQG